MPGTLIGDHTAVHRNDEDHDGDDDDLVVKCRELLHQRCYDDDGGVHGVVVLHSNSGNKSDPVDDGSPP